MVLCLVGMPLDGREAEEVVTIPCRGQSHHTGHRTAADRRRALVMVLSCPADSRMMEPEKAREILRVTVGMGLEKAGGSSGVAAEGMVTRRGSSQVAANAILLAREKVHANTLAEVTALGMGLEMQHGTSAVVTARGADLAMALCTSAEVTERGTWAAAKGHGTPAEAKERGTLVAETARGTWSSYAVAEAVHTHS